MRLISVEDEKLNRIASDILSEFSGEKIFNLLKDIYGTEEHEAGDIYSLLNLYDTTEDLDADLQTMVNGNLQDLRLFATAILISRIADKYGRILKKITTKYYGFHQTCKKISENKEK